MATAAGRRCPAWPTGRAEDYAQCSDETTFILAISLVILAGHVQAQEEPTLESLEIALWPEFDRPEVLVIYRGQLDADVALPALVEITLPARVGQPTAVAYVDEAGNASPAVYHAGRRRLAGRGVRIGRPGFSARVL